MKNVNLSITELKKFEEDPPDAIRGSWTSDLNILDIDEVIKFRLKSRKTEAEFILTQLEQGENAELRKKYNLLNGEYERYIQESSKLLEYYSKIKNSLKDGADPEDEERLIKLRISMIDKYLTVARNYITIDIVKKVYINNKCKCGMEKEKRPLVDASDVGYICPGCSLVTENLIHTSYFKDNSGTVHDEGGRDDASNFEKAINSMEGHPKIKFPKNFFSDIDELAVKKGWPSGEEIRKMEPGSDGRKPGTSMAMMWELMKESGHKYYADSFYAVNVYWGWVPHDLSKYRSDLMAMYHRTQPLYNNIKGEYSDRNASMATQIRLYFELMALEYPRCYREDFKIHESPKSIEFHENVWKDICKKEGIKFAPLR